MAAPEFTFYSRLTVGLGTATVLLVMLLGRFGGAERELVVACAALLLALALATLSTQLRIADEEELKAGLRYRSERPPLARSPETTSHLPEARFEEPPAHE